MSYFRLELNSLQVDSFNSCNNTNNKKKKKNNNNNNNINNNNNLIIKQIDVELDSNLIRLSLARSLEPSFELM